MISTIPTIWIHVAGLRVLPPAQACLFALQRNLLFEINDFERRD